VSNILRVKEGVNCIAVKDLAVIVALDVILRTIVK
jgi:hypothetical protein